MTPEELRTWRREHGLSRRALAEKLGVSSGALYWWETGQRRIPGPLVLALRYLHGCDLDAAKKRRRRAVERAHRESLRPRMPYEDKFW